MLCLKAGLARPLMGRRLIFPPSCNVNDTMYDSVSGVLRAECHGEWLLPVVTGLVNISAPSRSPSLLLCCPFYPSQDYTCHDNLIVSPRLGYIGQGGLYWFHWHNTLPLIGILPTVQPDVGLGERCRISPPCFLAECRRRRLNQASFVLLYFALFAFSGLCLVSVLSVFFICLLSCIFQHEPT